MLFNIDKPAQKIVYEELSTTAERLNSDLTAVRLSDVYTRGNKNLTINPSWKRRKRGCSTAKVPRYEEEGTQCHPEAAKRLVYKIPYRRARAWPSKGILHTTKGPSTKDVRQMGRGWFWNFGHSRTGGTGWFVKVRTSENF